jgi:O-Antigen ligase
VRRAVVLTAASVLLAGPTALAFFSGGYFEDPRLVAGLVAWVLVLAVALLGPRPLPARAPGWMALGGLAFLVAWTGASLTWAPLSTPATDSLQRLLLYLGALIAAIGLMRVRGVARALEPALAAGIVVVIGYGLSGRLLPGVIELARSSGGNNRLEQPLTYWNATGALAAIGLVLCARLAGDRSRPVAMRALAAAASAPLGIGVYLSYSRGAMAAAVVGLIVLLAVAPTRPQLRAAVTAVLAGLTAGACSAAFPGVASLSGSAADQERDGAIMLAILVVAMGAAGAAAVRAARAERSARGAADRLSFAGRLPAVAGAAVALVVAGLVIGGLGERGAPESERLSGASGSRLTTVSSRRYDYWRIGLDAFAREPLRGVGAGGYRTEWLRERPVREGVREVHSLELGMLAELGLPGLLALVVMLAGVGWAGRLALGQGRPIAAGCCAASTVWLLHASIDWDWEIPAVTLPVIVMAGALIVASEDVAEPASPASARAGRRRRPPARAREEVGA